MLFQVLGGGGRAVAGEVAGTRIDVRVGFGHAARHQVGVLQLTDGHRHVAAGGHEIGLAIVDEFETDGDLGIERTEFADVGHDEITTEARATADAQAAGRPRQRTAHRLAGLVHGVDHALRVLAQKRAVLGEADLARRAQEQALTEFGFERGELA